LPITRIQNFWSVVTDWILVLEAILMDSIEMQRLPCRIQQLLCLTCEIVVIFHKIPEESTVGAIQFSAFAAKKQKEGLKPP
jgi:hypothetical protein